MAHLPRDEFAAAGRAVQTESRAERRRLERAETKAASRVSPSRLYAPALRAMLRVLSPVQRMQALALLEGRAQRQDTFREWVDRVHPDYEWPPHLVALALVLQDVADGLRTRVMCFMPPRHGKLCADDTPVPTPNGWTTHGALKPGDEVFRPDGTPVRVIAVSEKAEADVRVEFTNGEVVYCHEAHEWTVYDRTANRWRTVETRHWLEETKFGPVRQVQSGGRSLYQLPDVGALAYPDAELPLHPYVLGAWLGDGTTSATCITHAPADVAVVEKVERCGYARSCVHTHRTTGALTTAFGGARGTGGPMLKGLRAAGGPMLKGLRAAGVFNNKHIPETYHRASIDQRLELMAGLVDTDGSVDADTGRVRIVTVSRRLADDVATLARSLGWTPSITVAAPQLSTSGIQGRRDTYTVGFQPDRALPVALERKQVRAFAARRRVGIKSVTRDPRGYVGHCITVAAEDGLYLVGRTCVPTHNSEQISRLFTAYFLYRHPGLSVALTTYGADLSYELSRDARNNFLAGGGQLSGDATAVKSWSTAQGGKLWATGVGGPATGRGFSLGCVDDPYKDHTEAGSAIVRKSRLAWYRSVFRTRAAPGAAIVILLTRWHQADLVGELLKEEEVTKQGWHILEMAAEKYTGPRVQAGDNGTPSAIKPHTWPSTVTIEPDARDHVTWLWAARFTVEEYESIKRGLGGEGGYFWNALYQQRPTAMEGGLFKEAWFKRIPRGQLPAMIGRMRRWDLAATENDGAFTAGLRVEKDAQKNYYITGLEHGQWEAGMRDQKIVLTARNDGMGVVQGFPIDPAAAGKQVAAQFPRLLDGISPVLLMPESGSKLLRLTMPASAASNGMLYIVDEPWAATVITELCAAGEGAEYWDIADALSGAFGYLGPLDADADAPRSYSLRTNR